MAAATSYVHFDPEWSIFLCTLCESGVRFVEIAAHYRAHGFRGPHLRHQLHVADRWYQEAGQPIPRIPPWVPSRIPHLAVTLCLVCTLCTTSRPYICARERHMRGHCNSVHRWHKGQPRGRRSKHAEPVLLPWRSNVPCQRIFKSGPDSSYFEVRAPGQNLPMRRRSESDRLLEQVLDVRAAARRHHGQYIQAADHRETTLWLRRTRWPQQFQGCSRPQLTQDAQVPDPTSEPHLVLIWNAIYRLLLYCQETIETSSSQAARTLVLQTQSSQRKQHPIQAYNDLATLKRNAQLWQRMILWFLRTRHRSPPARPAYELNSRQRDTLNQLE